jgi:hypothetical protein
MVEVVSIASRIPLDNILIISFVLLTLGILVFLTIGIYTRYKVPKNFIRYSDIARIHEALVVREVVNNLPMQEREQVEMILRQAFEQANHIIYGETLPLLFDPKTSETIQERLQDVISHR